MSEGKSREAWEHTSAMLAMIVNMSPGKKSSRKFTPLDFDPYAAAKKRDAGDSASVGKVGVDVLKDMFVDGRKAGRKK
jgi:hypothetical protein